MLLVHGEYSRPSKAMEGRATSAKRPERRSFAISPTYCASDREGDGPGPTAAHSSIGGRGGEHPGGGGNLCWVNHVTVVTLAAPSFGRGAPWVIGHSPIGESGRGEEGARGRNLRTVGNFGIWTLASSVNPQTTLQSF